VDDDALLVPATPPLCAARPAVARLVEPIALALAPAPPLREAALPAAAAFAVELAPEPAA